MNETYASYKREVMKLARQQNQHYVPGDDGLFRLWEQGVSAADVAAKHSTLEAARHRIFAARGRGM